uniref:glutathione transferase n=1 Tax=Culicoides sonorensis TaxID=179676 RepID=A0A336MCE1_CULSO
MPSSRQHALNIELDVKHINPFQGHSDEFLKLNPQHTVPTLVEHNVTLWDSHAIMVYLATNSKNSTLYPENPIIRAKIHQYLHFDSGILFARMRFAIDTVFHQGAPEIPKDRIENIYKAYDLFEATLVHSGTKYLVLDTNATIADISVFSSVKAMVQMFPVTKEKYPKILEWLDLMKKENFYHEVKEDDCDDASKIFFQKMKNSNFGKK